MGTIGDQPIAQMEATVRRATYHVDDLPFRVVFRHPNRWFVQVKTEREPSRTVDPWDDISPALESQDEAITLMYQRYPKLARKAA
jgi:hypothetical protein